MLCVCDWLAGNTVNTGFLLEGQCILDLSVFTGDKLHSALHSCTSFSDLESISVSQQYHEDGDT